MAPRTGPLATTLSASLITHRFWPQPALEFNASLVLLVSANRLHSAEKTRRSTFQHAAARETKVSSSGPSLDRKEQR